MHVGPAIVAFTFIFMFDGIPMEIAMTAATQISSKFSILSRII
jgi:hypothetical protein